MIKTIFLTAFAIFSISFGLYAQHVPQFGLKAGANFANVNQSGSTFDNRTALYAGLLAHVHITPHFAIQPELVYSPQGAVYANGITTKLNFINVPVLGQYMFGSGWRLETGPQIGLLTSAKNESGGTDTDVRNSFKKTDVSWAFGLGYLTKVNLGIDLRYNLGLSDLSNNASYSVKNSVWQVGLFYQFH